MASSRDSPQYKAVLSHLETLTTTLRVTPDAESTLLQKFQELTWLAIGAKASAKELVTLALNRVENDVKDYDVFINMLESITGMKTVVNKITVLQSTAVPQSTSTTSIPQSTSTHAVPQSTSTTSIPQSTSTHAVPQSTSTTSIPQSTSTHAVPQSTSTTSIPQSTSTHAVPQSASTTSIPQSTSTNVSTTVVSQSVLQSVPSSHCPQLTALKLALAHLPWSVVKNMAIHLHHSLTQSVLDQIGEDCSSAAERCTYCMELWLKNDLDASWRKLVMALCTVQQTQLAQDLELRYCQCMSQVRSNDTCTHTISTKASTDTSTQSTTRHTSLASQSLDMPRSKARKTQGVVKGYSTLQDQFASLVTEVQIYITRKAAKLLGRLRIMLLNLPLSNKYRHMRFLKEKEELIKAAPDVGEIFQILHPYWNHVDYSLLEHITMEFGNRKLKKAVKVYVSQLIKFEKDTTIQVFVDATCDDRQVPPEFRAILIELDQRPSDCTLYDVRKFKESLVCRSSLSAYSVYLKEIGVGSIVVSLAMPSDVVHVFVEAIQDLQFKRGNHIKSFRIEGHDDAAANLSHPHSPSPNSSFQFSPTLPSPSQEGSDLSKPPPHVEGKSIGETILVALRYLVRSEHDPEAKKTRFNLSLNRDATVIRKRIPTSSGHVLPIKHSVDTPKLYRQITGPKFSEKNSLDLPEELIYEGSMICAASGISALSDEDEAMSCPPSPAVSDYPGREEGDKIQHGPSISVDDSELFSHNDQQYDGRGPRDYHPSDQDPHYHLEEDLYHTHKYAPSQASSFGMHNLFEGHSQDGYAETDYGSQPEFHYHHASCDPQCSLGVPHYDNRTGSASSVRSDIHAHYHMTSRSHIRSSDGRKAIIQRRRSRSMDLTPVAEQPEPCATTPSVVLSDGATGLLYGPTVFSPAVAPSGEKLRVLSPATPSTSTIAPPVLLRISLSADNLPALCLNDCPIAATPLMQLGNRTLGSAMQSPLVTNQRRWSAGSAEGQREPVVKEKIGHQKDSPSSDEGHTTEHERYTSQDSSSSLQTTSTRSSGQSGKSEGTSVLGESGQRTHVFDAQTSISTTSTDMDDYMRRRQFQLWGKPNEITKNPDETMRLDSGYGTSGDMTDVKGSISKPRVPPDNLPLTPQKVPAKQKHVVPVDQPKHLAPSNQRGSTSLHGSHTSHLSVGSHVSQGSDGSITTQTLC